MPRVSPDHYTNTNYLSKQRLASYWHQLDEIVQLQPSSVLEIGVGADFLRHQLAVFGIHNVVSADIDWALKPNVVADARHLPFSDQCVDVAVAFQVLEHLPYEGFEQALRELKRVARKHVLISLPERTPSLRWMFSISQWKLNIHLLRIPLVWERPLSTDQHYWEIGLKGYPLSRIKESMRAAGLQLVKTYQVPEYPYHRFFVLANGA
ncbi:MAG: methyltransferase type 11 [Phototrophicales bacterium]|nr:MAG: methyltransferase type 11 [Phototrophicales bacterium]